MPTWFLIVLLVSVGVASLLFFIHLVGGLFRKRLEGDVLQRFANARILRKDMWANYFGRKQNGMGQIRGNGALVLTDSRLWFMLAAPRTEIDIPLSRITQVGTTRSHLGKSILRPLLLVEFDTMEGPDSIAWALRDTDGWVKAVNKAREPQTATK